MNSEAPRKPATETASHDAEDLALMDRIARHRDREAFATLFSRYKQAAFNLARHLTHNADEAEEAVQEGMLRAWSAAPSFKPQGSVRGWVLKIVVRECLRIRRERSSERNRIMRKREIELRESPKGSIAEPEQGEILRALHDRVMAMDETSRHLLALYYGANMSQEEIGEALAIPQTSVSRRIRDLLKDLRSHLATAGFAAAVPMVDSTLGQMLCTWEEAPASLGSRMLSRLGRESMRHSRPLLPAKTGTALWIWFAAAATVLATGAGYLAYARHSSNVQPAAHAKPADLPIRKEKGPIIYDCHFTDKTLDDFWAEAPKGPAWITVRADLTGNKTLFQPRASAPSGVGEEHSYLRLQAWGVGVEDAAVERMDGLTPESMAQRIWRPANVQTAEIVSQFFKMDDQPLSMQLDADPPYGEGQFEYGLEAIDQNGQTRYKQGYRAERRGEKYYLEDILVLNGKPTRTDYKAGLASVPPALNIQGAFKATNERVQPNQQQITNVVADVDNLSLMRLRLYVTAQPGAKVVWPIDRLVLSRTEIPSQEVHRFWSFASSTSGLKQIPGVWEWIPPTLGQPGGMKAGTSNEKSAWLGLPVRLPSSPFIVRAKVLLPPGQTDASFDSFWYIGSNPVKYQYWKGTANVPFGQWNELVHYFFDRYVICTCNGQLICVRETGIDYPSPRAYVSFRGLLVGELECKTIPLESIPQEYRDPARIQKSMQSSQHLFVPNRIEPLQEASE